MAGEQLQAPSGTVTFLFSDVVGSTRLWAADSDAMSAALRIHDQVFNESITKFGGYVFSTAGDSFGAAFNRASAAVDCADLIQRSLTDVDWGTWPVLSVRIGLHQGEAEERDDNYFGPAVNQTARVMAVAHGGQTLLTNGVRDASGASVTDLGTHSLRDIEQPIHLSQLGELEFPPLSSLGQSVSSLPLPRTSLVGRDEAVEEVRRLVAAHRLVTLTGVGGCGKTRLAIEVAHREVATFPEGVWFADLSTIADGVALPGAVASALGVMIIAGSNPVDQITTYLAPRQALLVMDNCEHVIDPSAEVVDILLERCPHLRIVATSRESLEVDGEYTWKVPSLAVGHHAAAVRLFRERAAAAGGVLLPDPTTTTAIVEVVERLDGIPLAIELAAARTRTMSVDEIRNLLDDRFSLLSGGARRSRQRQATLEGAVQWSYDLLSGDEQSMLRTLSVFQGGFSIGDVTVVAQRSEAETRHLVDTLTNKSLVDVTRDASGQVRHRLLETIRLFALARLVEADEAAAMRDRHLDHFSDHGVPLSLHHLFQIDKLIRQGREYENFRSATVWALDRDRPDAAVRMASLGVETAINRGEAQLALDVLRLSADLSVNDQQYAAAARTWLLVTQGNVVDALTAFEEARALDDEHAGEQRLFLMYCEHLLLSFLGDIRGSRTVIDEARRISLASGDPSLIAGCDLFINTWYQGVLLFDECIETCSSALALTPTFSYQHIFEAGLAWSLLATGRTSEAVEVVEAFTPIPPGSQWGHGNHIVTHLALAHSDGPEVAGRLLAPIAQEAVSRRPQIGGDFLTGFAYLNYISGDTERARFINDHSLVIGLAGVQKFMLYAEGKAAGNDVIELVEARNKDIPILELHRRSTELGPQILAEELARWS